MTLENARNSLTQSFGRGKLMVRKYSPEILLGLGILGLVGAGVAAVIATRKLEPILEDHEDAIETLEAEAHNISVMSGKEGEAVLKLKSMVYVHTALELIKLYGPSVGIGAASIAAILASHGIMANRQVALIAAYNMVNETLKVYRARVREELGEETDKMIAHGFEESEEKDVDPETGKKVTRKVFNPNPKYRSIYATYFDDTSTAFNTQHILNLTFLEHQQNYANDRLKIEGILFLNDVLRSLGLPITKAGQICGWVYSKDEEGNETKIDFGMMCPENQSGRSLDRPCPAISLDFNVQGIILELI